MLMVCEQYIALGHTFLTSWQKIDLGSSPDAEILLPSSMPFAESSRALVDMSSLHSAGRTAIGPGAAQPDDISIEASASFQDIVPHLTPIGVNYPGPESPASPSADDSASSRGASPSIDDSISSRSTPAREEPPASHHSTYGESISALGFLLDCMDQTSRKMFERTDLVLDGLRENQRAVEVLVERVDKVSQKLDAFQTSDHFTRAGTMSAMEYALSSVARVVGWNLSPLPIRRNN